MSTGFVTQLGDTPRWIPPQRGVNFGEARSGHLDVRNGANRSQASLLGFDRQPGSNMAPQVRSSVGPHRQTPAERMHRQGMQGKVVSAFIPVETAGTHPTSKSTTRVGPCSSTSPDINCKQHRLQHACSSAAALLVQVKLCSLAAQTTEIRESARNMVKILDSRFRTETWSEPQTDSVQSLPALERTSCWLGE